MVKTIDQLIDETASSLNQKTKDKSDAGEAAEKLKAQLGKFKQLKKNMDADAEYAAHFGFK